MGLRLKLIHVELLTVVDVKSVQLNVFFRWAFLHHNKVDTAAEILRLIINEVIDRLGKDNRSLVHVTELIDTPDNLCVFRKVESIHLLLTSNCTLDSSAEMHGETDFNLILISKVK